MLLFLKPSSSALKELTYKKLKNVDREQKEQFRDMIEPGKKNNS